jgi:aerobic-type carbon monoxide dehydrogenase small subunit (CoxS/CutS family)
MSTAAFLERTPDPTDEEMLDMLGGHLCRCTGYQNIIASVRQAAGEMRGEASPA